MWCNIGITTIEKCAQIRNMVHRFLVEGKLI